MATGLQSSPRMKRALVLAMILPAGCATGHRHHHRTDPVEALLVLTAAVATLAVEAAPPPPSSRPVVADVRIPPPDPTRPATFEGWVVAEDERGAVPFTVVILTGQHEEVRVLTNREGHFQISRPLSSGRYVLRVVDERWEGRAEADVREGVVPAVVVRASPAR
jgi:hypothetical protein